MTEHCSSHRGMNICACAKTGHEPRLVVLTGGPGAGKTAVLELIKKSFCEHIEILPEAASILFSGGFLRRDSELARKSAQRAIFHVQRELEQIVLDEMKSATVLCDRGSLDGLAYWVGDQESYFKSVGTSYATELGRYEAVVHLRSPSLANGYNHQNPVRIESAAQAAAIDEKIAEVWKKHPRYTAVQSSIDFMEKLSAAVALIKTYVPECCRSHSLK